MKRFHLNLKVSDLEKSRAYYANLFGQQPAVVKPDYIKWMLDDPFINFSIEPANDEIGIAHVGLQAESPEELQGVYERIQDAAGPRFEEGATTCCYASSEKNWTQDPDGLIWEAFYTDGQVTHYGKLPDLGSGQSDAACCLN
ncbi:VOC family protein [Parasphingorhabdus cellanae]|uniref:VOC family protein n=1 Tax=Parasphingorhabdus cellanae TaxID=2806553 RepID=A0ABX7T551_9SPHN|nr:VOC family protein [Parasphingorhabdus cellanae]QTD56671.1 VOC family protein [Parasphingorhabdus cellanae]